jgi:hypothetical protein
VSTYRYRSASELAQRLLHARGQHGLLRRRGLRDRYGPHGGSSFRSLRDHREGSQRELTRRRDRRPTKFYELWDNLA